MREKTNNNAIFIFIYCFIFSFGFYQVFELQLELSHNLRLESPNSCFSNPNFELLCSFRLQLDHNQVREFQFEFIPKTRLESYHLCSHQALEFHFELIHNPRGILTRRTFSSCVFYRFWFPQSRSLNNNAFCLP